MIYGYIRVSSDKQTVENQRFEINNFCRRENISIDGWIEETISGTKAYTKRQLGSLLKRIRKDDLILCAELSRLGRNLFMIMEILNICMTKEALARKRAEGVVLGRPKGRRSAPDKYKLSGKETLIRELMKEGVSQRKIAKICKVDRNTIGRYLKMMGETRDCCAENAQPCRDTACRVRTDRDCSKSNDYIIARRTRHAVSLL